MKTLNLRILFLFVAAIVCAIAGAFDPTAWMALPFAVGAALTEGQHTGEFILSEANGKRSRETVTVTVAADTTLATGSVLGKITATGKYVPYNNAAADGSEVAKAVLYNEIKNSGGAPADFDGVILNVDAEVRAADLQWNGQDGAAQTAGLADLLALGIKARG